MKRVYEIAVAANNDWEVYYVSNPSEAIGIPSYLRWNVSCKGDWREGYRTKGEAAGLVSRMNPSAPFEFFADNIGLAQDHADQLDSDPNFFLGRVTSRPRFVRWAEDGSL